MVFSRQLSVLFASIDANFVNNAKIFNTNSSKHFAYLPSLALAPTLAEETWPCSVRYTMFGVPLVTYWRLVLPVCSGQGHSLCFNIQYAKLLFSIFDFGQAIFSRSFYGCLFCNGFLLGEVIHGHSLMFHNNKLV